MTGSDTIARLYVTAREIQFINDITKEFMKDIVGQTINYYPVSVLKTQVHPIYDEAVKKIFDNPIRVPCLANFPEVSSRTNIFGSELVSKIEVYVQARDLIDKGFTIYEGDFFTFGDQAYEIVSFVSLSNVYGQEEYEVGYKIMGNAARAGQFDPKTYQAPTKDSKHAFPESGAQVTFEQQRGLDENLDGPTGDVRQMRDRLGDDMAEIALGEGPRVVGLDNNQKGNSFYNDEDDEE